MIVTTTKSTYRAGSAYTSQDDSHVAPEANPPVITASSYSGGLTISDQGAGGTFTLVPTFTDKWTYVPLNRTRAVSVRVTDGVGHVDTPIQIYGTWPINPQYGYDFDTPTSSKVILAKDNSPKFRRMPTRTASWRIFHLNRTILDVSVCKDFEQWHDIDKEFYFIDPELVQTLLVRLDSSVSIKINGANNFEIDCLLKIYKLASLSIPIAYV